MYNKFTERARHVMVLAKEEARRSVHNYIGTEHLLLGLLKESTGVAAHVLKSLGMDLKKTRADVAALVQTGSGSPNKEAPPFTPRTKKVLEWSMEEARGGGHNYVGTEHLLLGLLRVDEGPAAQILRNMGLKFETVRKEVLDFIGVERTVTDQVTTEETIAQYTDNVIGNYTRIPAVMVKGQGSYIWDQDGKKYLDLFPGWGVNGLGHCHPDVVAAVREQAGRLMHVANNYYNENQGRLAGMIAERSFGGQCFFCNSGAEAVEAAIKLARIFSAPRYKIITMNNSFHGRTSMAMVATAQPKYQKGLPPADLGFKYVPFNDAKAAEEAVDDDTCAIMVEPIQGEGGVNVPDDDYLQALRDICDKRGLLLIYDEVTTGSGRTGKYYAYQHFGVEPDIMTLAKSMGGGLAVGAIEARQHVAEKLVPGTHASTFGGNPIACAGAIAMLEVIDRHGLLDHTTRIGELLKEKLRALASKVDIITDVRGKGAMIGMELKVPGADFVKRCMQAGLLINCTHDTVIRFYPSMAAAPEEIEEGAAIVEKVLSTQP